MYRGAPFWPTAGDAYRVTELVERRDLKRALVAPELDDARDLRSCMGKQPLGAAQVNITSQTVQHLGGARS